MATAGASGPRRPDAAGRGTGGQDAPGDRPSAWAAEVGALRALLVEAGLTEQIKWNKPCFTHEERNIAIVQEMRSFLALMFFKGALLDDRFGVLRPQGPSTRWAMRVELTSLEEVHANADALRDLVAQAIAFEATGVTPAHVPDLELVAELAQRLAADPGLAAAFDRLTPGRRRQYDLEVRRAKQPSTREARIDRFVPLIRAGKGLRDR